MVNWVIAKELGKDLGNTRGEGEHRRRPDAGSDQCDGVVEAQRGCAWVGSKHPRTECMRGHRDGPVSGLGSFIASIENQSRHRKRSPVSFAYNDFLCS